jgi:hypothetical protein
MCASFIFMFFLSLSFSPAISLPNVFVYLPFIQCYFLLLFSRKASFFFASDAGRSPIYLGSSSYHKEKWVLLLRFLFTNCSTERKKFVYETCNFPKRGREKAARSAITPTKRKRTTQAYIHSYCPKFYTYSYIDIWGLNFTFHVNCTLTIFCTSMRI